MMRTARLLAVLLLAGFLSSSAWAGDADRFRDLIPGEPLTEEELAQYHGRGVNLAAQVRFAETFAETFLESALENLSFTFNERLTATAGSSLGTTGVTSGAAGGGAGVRAGAAGGGAGVRAGAPDIKRPAAPRMPTVTPASRIRARIFELRTTFRSKF